MRAAGDVYQRKISTDGAGILTDDASHINKIACIILLVRQSAQAVYLDGLE